MAGIGDINLIEGGFARLIGRGFKKGCVLIYCSSAELKGTVKLNGVGGLGAVLLQTL
jgi:hypothetical protein